MDKNEILVFIQHDSDCTSHARCGFYAAIRDPTVKNMKDVPPKESIEARLVAFFLILNKIQSHKLELVKWNYQRKMSLKRC